VENDFDRSTGSGGGHAGLAGHSLGRLWPLWPDAMFSEFHSLRLRDRSVWPRICDVSRGAAGAAVLSDPTCAAVSLPDHALSAQRKPVSCSAAAGLRTAALPIPAAPLPIPAAPLLPVPPSSHSTRVPDSPDGSTTSTMSVPTNVGSIPVPDGVGLSLSDYAESRR
jgi:hypothetical protein